MAQSYKSLKEDFVSNLSGGAVWEINYVTAVAPAAVLLWSALQSRRDFFVNYGPTAFTIDFLLNVGAILAATTIYSSAPIALNTLLILPAVLLHIPTIWSRSRPKKYSHPTVANGRSEGKRGQDSSESLPERPFITHYRGSMMVVTCVAILAVDFRVFPRRFAKVETWGTSLMDMGVGSFVFAAGLASARPVLKAGADGKATSIGPSLLAAARHSLPLLLLGFIRLYSVKGLDYAEHVSEYGVHWNFFFTLALLPPFTAIVQILPQSLFSVHSIALAATLVYQAVLDTTSLKAYVLTAPRDNLLSQNREGLSSFIGYFGIFLVGQAVGLDILPRKTPATVALVSGLSPKQQILTRLVVWSAWFSVLLCLAISYRTFGLQVSRRLANLPYMLWVSTFNCAQLALFCAIEALMFPGLYSATDQRIETRRCKHATSQVLGAFNANGLAIFLLANLMTGLVNLSTNTLQANRAKAMVTLFLYTLALASIATSLYAKKIKIKL
ncbi:Glucosaminyl phosphatidylinositol (GlcN-PI) nositol acylation protein [Xanthoria parietina]